MSFDSLNIPLSITTSTGNPVKELFVPALREAEEYDVAVGYFTTGWIRDVAEGIAELASKGGRCRWIISPSLSEEDWKSISQASFERRRDLVNQFAMNDIVELTKSLQKNTRDTLSWLIIDDIIKFKIAVPKNQLQGIFHAKIGVFRDFSGNKIAFSGSYNLTAAAKTNWENIDIYSSKRSNEVERINSKENEFELMWNNLDPNLEAFEPNDSTLSPFIEITKNHDRPYKHKKSTTKNVPVIPTYFLDENGTLRKHQERALNNWFKNNGRGIFNMATGSGKTVTALSAATRLCAEILKQNSSIIIITTVPYKHLAEQWLVEASNFGFEPILCYGDYSDWPSKFGELITDLNQSITSIVFVISVNKTYSGEKFQSFLNRINTNFLLIADEMHNLGARKIKECLPENANFRLGLSATPIRKNDDLGSKLLADYFGKQIIKYGIKEAIADGTLTKYYYYPVLVEFTDEEMGEYKELSIRIGRLFAQGEDEESSALSKLLIKRGRLIGRARNKIFELRKLLTQRKSSKYNLVYVGDDKTDDIKQVELVLKIIGNEVGMRANKFTSVENVESRRKILKEFGSGELQAVVAIRCLDEGVDIPRTETAYILASTTNPKQFIQRRGRVLRKAEGKEFAYVYDFIVVPPSHDGYFNNNNLSTERKLMMRELERVNEFTETAFNGGEAQAKLAEIKKRLNLLDK